MGKLLMSLKPFRILLSNLVSELEGHRIENIQMQPKSQAGCLQNIRKAL